MPDETALPKYRCHKVVSALKIAKIMPVVHYVEDSGQPDENGAVILPTEPGYAAFRVDAEYLRKHNPQAGGYYVLYEDGYQSLSPSVAFETGYTRISE